MTTTASAPERLVLPAPPVVEPPEVGGGALATALPVVGSLGSVLLLVTSGGEARTRALLAAALFLLATGGFVLVQLDRQRQHRLRRTDDARRRHLHELALARAEVREVATRQRRALARRLPAPATVACGAAPARWEDAPASGPRPVVAPGAAGAPVRAPLLVRWGCRDQPLAVELVAPEPEPGADPVGVRAVADLLATHRDQPDLPAALDLRAFATVQLATAPGPARGAGDLRAVARALVCSAAAAHAPHELIVAALVSRDRAARWEWLKWLPHAAHPTESDLAGPLRLVVTDAAALGPLLERGRTPGGAPAPHLLVVHDADEAGPADGPALDGLAADGVTVLRVGAAPGRRAASAVLDPGPQRAGPVGGRLLLEVATADPTRPHLAPVVVHRDGDTPFRAVVDRCGPATAEALARRLAAAAAGDDARAARAPGPAAPDPDRHGALPADLADVAVHGPGRLRSRRTSHGRLRVHLGAGDAGPVTLDLREPAQGGDGPHGLVVGATGSGKSELLRSLVLGLATTHGSDELNLVLVDFKGGAAFAGLARLPHVAALITNLEREADLVDRMHDALAGEVVRRQELLRTAGVASLREHDEARAAGAPLDPLPSLLVVVDELSELVAARPEVVDLLGTLGRLGRSLGIHLLLASQRLEEGRLRGLEAHLSYRVALRTFSAAESRAVLGVPDAAVLPARPGAGLLRRGATDLEHFRAPFVSGPHPWPRTPAGSAHPDGPGRPDHPDHLDHPDHPEPLVVPFTASPLPRPADDHPAGDGASGAGPSLLDATVRALEDGPPAHRVWLPPLDRAPTLDRLLPDLAADPVDGLVAAGWRRRHGDRLVLPVGVVDRPREQRRDPLLLDLGAGGGHVAVVGGTRSGTSTALLTVAAGLALTRTPREAQLLVLDLGDGSARDLAGLPHVAGIATRHEPGACRRLVQHVRALVDRPPSTGGTVPAGPGRGAGRPEVLLLVDGWATLRAELPDLEEELTVLAGRALAGGVHLVVTARRWADLRPAVRDLLGTRVELRLGDPLDSEVDRRTAAQVPPRTPGRALVPGPRGALHALTALPRVDGDDDPATVRGGLADLVARVAAAWPGPSAEGPRSLPEVVHPAEVRAAAHPAATAGAPAAWVGLAEADLGPVRLDLATDHPHLVVTGGPGSGRTTALRTALHALTDHHPADALQVLVVDPRRGLLGDVPGPHLLAHLDDATEVPAALRALVDRLRSRPAGLPRVVVAVDDPELLSAAAGGAGQLACLAPALVRADELGLHVLLAHRAPGSRWAHDPTVQALHDLGAATLTLREGRPGAPTATHPGARECVPWPPGRGRLEDRRGSRVVQLSLTTPRARG